MKPVYTFVLGAALAAGVAYFIVGQKEAVPPAVPVAAVEPTVTPAAPAPVPEPTAVEPEPPAKPRVEERARPVRRREERPRTEAARNRPVSEPPVQTPVAQPAPAQQQPEPPQQEQPRQGSIVPSMSSLPPPPEERKPERIPNTVTIPAGATLTVRIDQSVNSQDNQVGDKFRATLDQPLVVDGFVVAERGSRVQGSISNIDQSGRVRGLAAISLELNEIRTSDGQNVRIQTETFRREAESTRKGDAAKVGAAAGIGAAIGAIAGGGKGAALGAVLGGAAGTGGVMATRGKPAEVQAETRLTFRLTNPVTVTEKLK